MGTPYTFDEGMSCHLTRIKLFYFDDNFRRIAQWVPPLTTQGNVCFAFEMAQESEIRKWFLSSDNQCANRACAWSLV